MAVYTIQRDPPWQKPPPQSRSHARSSYATVTTASQYSDDEDPDMTKIPPLRVNKSQSQPKQHVRHSRLPIFKQVRSMLYKTPLTNPAEDDQDLESATNAFREAYETTAYRSSEKLKASRSPSPVSVLHDDDLYPSSPPLFEASECPSPVSPITASPSLHYAREHRMRPLQVHVPAMPKTPAPHVVKRKPAPGRMSLSSNSNANAPSSRDSNTQDFIIKGSHFSWTTGAPSPTSTRPPSDLWPHSDADSFQTPRHCSLPEAEDIPKSHFSWTTQATSLTQHTRHGHPPEPDKNPNSHFSWTTQATSLTQHPQGHPQEPDKIPKSHFSWTSAGTSLTHQTRPDTPPPSPPPIPTKYRTPPVKSILSRHRPIQRMDREQWAPPRKTSLPGALYSSPMSSRSKLSLNSPTTLDTGSGKKLPPPPDLSPKTHLESLQREQDDKIHQRNNIQRVISELSKIQNASPMEVPFSHVRDAKRRLGELKATLSEIELEEREIGIAISRARRKEGEEEGLWVRRVTG